MTNYNEPTPSDAPSTNVLIGIVLVIVIIVTVILFSTVNNNPQAGDAIIPTATMSEMLESPMPEMEATAGDESMDDESMDDESMDMELEPTATAQG